jgi:membrane-associated protease RseP (regulator of RpoE activity)
MKRLLSAFLITGSCLILLSACAATKKTYERGWIGGEYLESSNSFFKKISDNYFRSNSGVIPVLPEAIGKARSGAVFVSRIFKDTPLNKAGIKAGDLILAVNTRKVESLEDFHKLVDHCTPGEKISLTIYRSGETMNLPVVVGRETYQRWHYFSLGFRLASVLDPIPTPDFNILGVISFKQNDTRLELHSPEYKYYLRAKAYPPGKSERTPDSEADAEGWDAWFVIFGLSGKTIVISQQI